MTELENEWARGRIEAMADGSLGRAEARRMRAAMEADPQLRAAVASALRMRIALGRLSRVPVPARLRRRLWAVPRPARRAARRPAGRVVAAAAATVLVAVIVVAALPRRVPPPPPAQAEAVKNFSIAMTYLQRTATIADRAAARAVGDGFRDALTASRDALRDRSQSHRNGD